MLGRWDRSQLACRHSFALRLAACFVFETAATILAGLQVRNDLIWVANGLLLSYLLLAPRRRWPGYIVTALAAQLISLSLVHTPWFDCLLCPLLNGTEVLIAASLLRRRDVQLPDFTDRWFLVRFSAYAILAGPLIAGSIFAAADWLHSGHPGWPTLRDWMAADGLGAAVVTPACVAIFQARMRQTLKKKRQLIYLGMLAAVTYISFHHSAAPILSLIYPLLIIILLSLGLGWASLSILFVMAAGEWSSIHAQGPIYLVQSPGFLTPGVRLQFFVASAMFMVYSISVVLENLQSAERRLQEALALHEVVTENSRDIIMICSLSGIPRYISPAVFAVTGWEPEESMNFGFSDVAHPDDLPRIQAMVAGLRAGPDRGVIEYRISKRWGGHVWVEGSLRTIQDPHDRGRTAILQIVRDISERKQVEQDLEAAYRAVEEMAIVDALTGVANRRRFDDCFNNEWRRGIRERNPLSLILLDVDLFKRYNDTYGHLRGDSCLRQIADIAMKVITRPGDVLARFGGEEFAIILPDTDQTGARRLAAEVCSAVRACSLLHSSSPHGFVTVSAGYATFIPQLGQSPSELIEIADRALYEAKRRGRNLVCGIGDMETPQMDGQTVEMGV